MVDCLVVVTGDTVAKMYLKLAGCYLKSKDGHCKYEAAMAYMHAGDIYKKISAKDAISCLCQAVNQFLEVGRFQMAGLNCEVIGKLYELEQNIEKAIVYFERGADLFQSEEPFTSADQCNRCKQKVAQFSAQLEQYPRAIVIYEDFAKESLNKNLSKSSVTGYLLNAGLRQLCKADVVVISNALERYELDPTFSGTREYKFLAVSGCS
ncbi:alpha-soluble NSF attachment protein-like [Papaver somniferum]|uniref:alpha-soluble NSF attachment protein-like n=1 Tax=Papaver somniferum TaxID=3469 RepID=UPI000E6FF77A|nr:alpha-soluble NSF attachment protein-like [Papaver somniferum]